MANLSGMATFVISICAGFELEENLQAAKAHDKKARQDLEAVVRILHVHIGYSKNAPFGKIYT